MAVVVFFGELMKKKQIQHFVDGVFYFSATTKGCESPLFIQHVDIPMIFFSFVLLFAIVENINAVRNQMV